MKKFLLFFSVILFTSCGPTKVQEETRPLYEILVQKNAGGAKFKFFEIISQPEEFVMIQGDPELKNKIRANDINTANFLILSLGEKPTGGFGIGIEKAEETATNIIVTVKEIEPQPGAIATQVLSNPYCVVRINSKKEIIIK